MKIALVGIALPPIMGGLEVHIHQLAHHLQERGHQVTVYGARRYRGRILPSSSIEGSVRTERERGTVTLGPYEFYEPIYVRLARRLGGDDRPDVVHAHCVYPSAIAAYLTWKRTGVPYVVTSHGDEIMEFGRTRIYGAAKKMLIRRFFKHASFSIAVSEELKQLAIGFDSPPQRTERFSNVIDTTRFAQRQDRAASRAALGLPADAEIVLSLRRLSLKNGIHYLLRAFERFAGRRPNARLLLCGDGEMRGALEELALRLGIAERVTFLGTVPNDQVHRVIAAADLAVFPSLAEATSIACLEVMACGVPVVVSDVGGLPEIVTEGKTGIIVPFGLTASTFRDPGLPDEVVESLSSAIEGLLHDRPWRDRLGAAAREEVLSTHSWTSYAERMEGVYERVIRERHA